jgi:hypothetical protein
VVRNAQQPVVVYASDIEYHPNGAIQRFTYGNDLCTRCSAAPLSCRGG